MHCFEIIHTKQCYIFSKFSRHLMKRVGRDMSSVDAPLHSMCVTIKLTNPHPPPHAQRPKAPIKRQRPSSCNQRWWLPYRSGKFLKWAKIKTELNNQTFRRRYASCNILSNKIKACFWKECCRAVFNWWKLSSVNLVHITGISFFLMYKCANTVLHIKIRVIELTIFG